MPITIKLNSTVKNLAEKVHNLATDALMIALSNTAPASETNNPINSNNNLLANVTQISYANYSDDMTVDRRLQSVTSTETGGQYTLDAADVTITAVGGALPTFRYIYIYNDTPAGDPLLYCIDNEAGITLAVGESVTLRVAATGLITLQ